MTMVDFKEIEALLKEVVGGKKLSGTKITKLQEIVMKSLKHDTKLVSMLYRTHKSLPNSQKVSSLYVFDALARAARHQANKHSLPVKENTGDKPGNAGTFLFKLEGVLDGLIEDMVAVDTPEAMEKTRKVLEIWTKANTFPADVLSRLLQYVNPGEQGTPGEKAASTPKTSTPTQAETQATVLNDLPPAILALLGANVSVEGTGAPPAQPVTPPVVPNPLVSAAIDPARLALLQHLTQQAQQTTAMTSSNYYPTQPPGNSLPTGQEHSYTTGPVYIPPQHGATRRHPEEREDLRRSGYNRDRYDSPPPGRGYPARAGQDRHDRQYGESYDDDRRRRRPMPNLKETGSRWERPPPPRRPGSRSRSRSPPPRTSDPRINSPATQTQSIPTFIPNVAVVSKPQPPPPPTRPIETYQSRETTAPSVGPHTIGQGTMQGPNTTSNGLDSFDLSTFDTTSAAHWMSLGAAFKVTHGRDGTQEELVSTFTAMKNGFPLPTISNGTSVNPSRNAWQEKSAYHGPQSGYTQPSGQVITGHRISAWETREQDEMKRGNRQVGHGSYDGAGTGHALHAGRWQSDAIVLTGDDD